MDDMYVPTVRTTPPVTFPSVLVTNLTPPETPESLFLSIAVTNDYFERADVVKVSYFSKIESYSRACMICFLDAFNSVAQHRSGTDMSPLLTHDDMTSMFGEEKSRQPTRSLVYVSPMSTLAGSKGKKMKQERCSRWQHVSARRQISARLILFYDRLIVMISTGMVINTGGLLLCKMRRNLCSLGSLAYHALN